MNEWIKVVTNPLGLVGFVLFLVFGALARAKRQDERRWLSPLAMVTATLALIGGLTLAYVQTPKVTSSAATPTPATPVSEQQTNQNVEQHTSGPGSPTVQGVRGDVTITIDQSDTGKSAATAAQKPRSKRGDQ
jgi:hypothetical protein